MFTSSSTRRKSLPKSSLPAIRMIDARDRGIGRNRNPERNVRSRFREAERKQGERVGRPEIARGQGRVQPRLAGTSERMHYTSKGILLVLLPAYCGSIGGVAFYC